MSKAMPGVRNVAPPVVPGSTPKPTNMDYPSDGTFPMVHGTHPARMGHDGGRVAAPRTPKPRTVRGGGGVNCYK